MEVISKTHILKNGDVVMDVTIGKDDGSQITKRGIFLEDYLMLFEKNSLKKEKDLVTIGSLPKGYITGSIGSPGTFNVAFFVPAEKRAVLYEKMHFYVPFPHLVMGFKIVGGAVAQSLCFATDKLDLDGKAYRYPFGNVSEEGGICFGNIALKKCMQIKDVEDIADAFFCSETNNDYFDEYKVTIAVTQGKLLERLKKKEEFPLRWLSPCEHETAHMWSVKEYLSIKGFEL